MLDQLKHIHFIGIGGIGVSALALMMCEQGKKVSGSDLKASDLTDKLKLLGATIFIGHDPDQVAHADLVVYSTAVKPDNQELMQAVVRGIPLMHRAKLLGLLTQEKQAIAITGAHGKTTTSAMLVGILEQAALHPTFMIGGIANQSATNARGGLGPYMVVEADESDGSFLDLFPKIAVITNIDVEHLDYYKTMPLLEESFAKFATLVPKDGWVIANYDDPRLRRVVSQVPPQCLQAFSLQAPSPSLAPFTTWAEIHDAARPCHFTLHHRGERLGVVKMAIGGAHNIANATAAAAVARLLGCSPEVIVEALSQYQGVKRRSQLKGEVEGVRIYDDYAHHPTEVTALLTTLRTEAQRQSGRLIALFQPHRFSRFKLLFEEFVKAYTLADLVIVLPVYGAHEDKDFQASPRRLAKLLKETHHIDCHYVVNLQEATLLAKRLVRANDVVVTTGAGDVTKVSDALVKGLQEAHAT